MINYVLPAAVAAIALGGPPQVHAQMMPQPTPLPTQSNTINVNATITGQPQPGPSDNPAFGQGYGAPMPAPYPRPGLTPRTTWIPGGYNWDPNRNTYVWNE